MKLITTKNLLNKCKRVGIIQNNTYDLFQLDNAFCFEPVFSDFGGPDSFENYTYVIILVRDCNYQTEKKYNIKCATEKEKIDYFKQDQRAYLHMYYQINKLSETNLTNPIQNQVLKSQINIDIFNKKQMQYAHLYLKQSTLESDEGILFPEKNLYNFTEFDQLDVNLEASADDGYAKIYLRLSRVTSTYKRYYIKLVDVLAKVGGVLKVATFVIQILYSFYLENEFYIVLYNKIFKLQADEVKTFELLNSNQIKNKENLEESNNKLQEELEKVVVYKSKKRKNVHINFLERARFYCCYKKVHYVNKIKCDLIQTVDIKIRKRLEIFELFKQLDQFRLTAKLFLNENQCFMLQNIGRKLITNQFDLPLGSEQFCKHMEDKHNLLQENLLNYLKEKKQNNLMTNIDLALYRNLDLNTAFKEEADKIIFS